MTAVLEPRHHSVTRVVLSCTFISLTSSDVTINYNITVDSGYSEAAARRVVFNPDKRNERDSVKSDSYDLTLNSPRSCVAQVVYVAVSYHKQSPV